jgi:Domain of unknown function (DUF5753)
MVRQRLLELKDAPRYEAVIDEAVLHRVVGSRAVMHAQLERLLAASLDLPTVDVRVIRFDAGPLPAGNNKFILLRFAAPELPTLAFVEGLTGDLYLHKPEDVKVYTQAFRALSQMALPVGETRDLLRTMLHYYGDETG